MADEITIIRTTGGGPPPPRKIYEVVAESGLFKAGKYYAKGEKIELDVQAAANFLIINDIKEVSNET